MNNTKFVGKYMKVFVAFFYGSCFFDEFIAFK